MTLTPKLTNRMAFPVHPYKISLCFHRFSTWELLHNTLKKMMKHKAKVKEDLEDAHEKLDVLIDKAKKEVCT